MRSGDRAVSPSGPRMDWRFRIPYETLTEFDDVTGRNTPRRAVKQVAIDHGAKLRRRQRVISPHQVSDFETAIFADGFQRCDHVADIAAIGERQQQPLI